MKLIPGSQLTQSEISQIDEASRREFKVPFNSVSAKDRLFFLLKDGDQILALCALAEVTPVIFQNDTFSVIGVYDVIATIKGKGYGRAVVTVLMDHPSVVNKTIIGFCMPHNTGFYEKCGFSVTTNSTQRFVYTNGDKRITNQDGQFIFYRDGNSHFMENILNNSVEEVAIPTDNLW